MGQTEIIQIIKAICDISSINGSGLNKVDLARKLLDHANVPQNAEIQKIPVSENNQVRILFFVPGDDDYYSLFAGIGTDGNFYFELSGIGILKEKGLELYDEEKVLPADYFVSVQVEIEYSKSAAKYINSLDRPTKQRIKAGIEGLTKVPPEGDIKLLQGYSDGRKRLRIGKYRIIYNYYHKEDTKRIVILYIMDVNSRGDIYK